MTDNGHTQLTLIVKEQSNIGSRPQSKQRKANMSGKEDGAIDGAIDYAKEKLFGVEKIDTLDVQNKMNDVVNQVESMLENVNLKVLKNMRLSSVDVGLAVSAEGSIGIATAGVEASVTLSFEIT